MNPNIKLSPDGWAIYVRGVLIELPKHISQFKDLKKECETCEKIGECLTSNDRSLFCEMFRNDENMFSELGKKDEAF